MERANIMVTQETVPFRSAPTPDLDTLFTSFFLEHLVRPPMEVTPPGKKTPP